MNIPDSIWPTLLGDGTTLEARVAKKPPTIRPATATDVSAFIAIWKERLNDAIAAKAKDREQHIRLLLQFIEPNQKHEFALLVWGPERLSAVFDATSQKIFVIE
jgi:hypothetical protein